MNDIDQHELAAKLHAVAAVILLALAGFQAFDGNPDSTLTLLCGLAQMILSKLEKLSAKVEAL